MGVLSLRNKMTRSPARDALAASANELIGLGRLQAVAKTSLARAVDLRDQCRDRLDRATAAAEEARVSHSDAMLRSAETGEGVAIASSSRELRYAEVDAREDLAAAERAVEVMQERMNEPDSRVVDQRNKVGACVRAVIADQAEGALAEADRLFGLMARQRLICMTIREYLDRDHPLYSRLNNYYEYPGYQDDRKAIELEWGQAFDALVANPDAALPLIHVDGVASAEAGAA